MLGLQTLRPSFRLLLPTPGALSAAGASATSLRLRHAHHLVSDAICLLLVFVSRLVDRQFRPYRARGRRMYGNLTEIVSEARRCRSSRSSFGFFTINL